MKTVIEFLLLLASSHTKLCYGKKNSKFFLNDAHHSMLEMRLLCRAIMIFGLRENSLSVKHKKLGLSETKKKKNVFQF